MKQIVEVDFPIGLRVGGKGQILSRLLAGDPRGEALLVDPSRLRVELGLLFRELGPGGLVEIILAPCLFFFDCIRQASGGVFCAESIATE